MSDKIQKTEGEWQSCLTADEYAVTRCSATEAPFTGRYWDSKTPGIYHCICCDQPLFSSEAKYDSGSGWPSYWEPLSPDAVTERRDSSHGMTRVEILCSRCDAHLGHVFPDGPEPTGLRYCMNSLSLRLEAQD